MKESVMVVNTKGKPMGTMDKMAAHRSGVLHSAFSVFIFNHQGQLLLQQRATGKYHSGGLWTNTCCSHPRLGEPVTEAAHRRLREEMGMECQLTEVFQFTYYHEFENGLTEHEYDHVLIGVSDQEPQPDPLEVASYQYVDVDTLQADMINKPEEYTAWLKISLERVLENYLQLYSV